MADTTRIFQNFSQVCNSEGCVLTGSSPVTDVTQPVAMLRSIIGDPVIAVSKSNNTVDKGVLGRMPINGRRNMLRWTDDVSQWYGSASGSGSLPIKTPFYALGPGETENPTASRIQMSIVGYSTPQPTVSDSSFVYNDLVINLPEGTTYTTSFWVRSTDASSTYKILIFDNSTNNPPYATTLVEVTGEWKLVKITTTRTGNPSISSVTRPLRIWLRGTYETSDYADFLIWQPQFEYGPERTNYQSVKQDYVVDEYGADVRHFIHKNSSYSSMLLQPSNVYRGQLARLSVGPRAEIKDVVLDSSGLSDNILTDEGLIDFVLKDGSFTDDEITNLVDFWKIDKIDDIVEDVSTLRTILEPDSTALNVYWNDPKFWFKQAYGQAPVTDPGDPVMCWIPDCDYGPDIKSKGVFRSAGSPPAGGSWNPLTGFGMTTRASATNVCGVEFVGLDPNSMYELDVTRTGGTASGMTVRLGGLVAYQPTAIHAPGVRQKLYLPTRYDTTPATIIGLLSGEGTSSFQVHSLRKMNGVPVHQWTSINSAPIASRYPKTGRRNLLGNSHNFVNSNWSTTSGGIITDVPAGTMLTLENNSSTIISSIIACPVGDHVITFRLTPGTAPNGVVTIYRYDGATFLRVWYNLITGQISPIWPNSALTLNMTPVKAVMRDVGGGSKECSLVFNNTLSQTLRFGISMSQTPSNMNGVAGNTITINAAQFEKASDPTPIQRVNSPYDISEPGVESTWFLYFDGVDDILISMLPVDMSGSDTLATICGVNFIAGRASEIVHELGNNGAGGCRLYRSVNASIDYTGRGNRSQIGGDNAFMAISPPTNVVVTTRQALNSGERASIQLANSYGYSTSTTFGGGNFAADKLLHIGGRTNATPLRYQGMMGPVILRGGPIPSDEIMSQAQDIIRNNTGGV